MFKIFQVKRRMDAFPKHDVKDTLEGFLLDEKRLLPRSDAILIPAKVLSHSLKGRIVRSRAAPLCNDSWWST